MVEIMKRRRTRSKKGEKVGVEVIGATATPRSPPGVEPVPLGKR